MAERGKQFPVAGKLETGVVMMKNLVVLGLGLPVTLTVALSYFPAAQVLDLTTIRLNEQDCGPEGLAKSVPGKAIDKAKNRFDLPTEDDIDPDVSLAAMLAPGKDKDRFSQKKAATVQGIVIEVIVGGKETCNCGATKPDERDTHIELALSSMAPEIQRVIVEVTPRLRLLMKAKKEDWSTDALREKIKGQWIEVTGWLLFDTPHIGEAENTNPGHKGNWRATCWEVHPVTSITVLTGAPSEADGFSHKSFAALQGLHAAQATRTAKSRTALADFHKAHLAPFDDTELQEAREEAESRRPKKID
jgi:hypothetical protein